MTSDLKKLFQSLKNKQFAPFYLIDGEETFYIDLITEYFENNILQPAEKDFNLMILYGKDAEWPDVVNACRRFPMFAERQVVILKDAAQMRTLGELEGYLANPSPTTVFLIEHRFKKTDGRSKLVKLAKEKGFYLSFEKIKDEKVPQWIENYGVEIDFHVGQREAQILATYLGNDLQKIVNEIEKVRINVPGEKTLTADLIQKYIGVSRDYNVFEMPEALTTGNKDKLYRMLSYFIANPKSAAMPLVIGSFYGHYNKLYQACSLKGKSDKEIASAIGLPEFIARNLIHQSKSLSLEKLEDSLMLIGKYSAKSVGVEDENSDSDRLKEFIGRLELITAG
jgi:DNA polymerase III subunit delta